MSSPSGSLDEELQILFGALCDGLRQEVRSRQLADLAIRQRLGGPNPLAVHLREGREGDMAPALARQLRSVGFFVQTESYFADIKDGRLRPDYRIWLPASGKYLYLELKTYGWGDSKFSPSYYYKTTENAIQSDVGKLKGRDLPNGSVVVGFSKPDEGRQKMCLSKAFQDLSGKIFTPSGYHEIGVNRIELLGMDAGAGYAMVGLWVRKS